MSLVERIPTFRMILAPQASSVRQSKSVLIDCLASIDGARSRPNRPESCHSSAEACLHRFNPSLHCLCYYTTAVSLLLPSFLFSSAVVLVSHLQLILSRYYPILCTTLTSVRAVLSFMSSFSFLSIVCLLKQESYKLRDWHAKEDNIKMDGKEFGWEFVD